MIDWLKIKLEKPKPPVPPDPPPSKKENLIKTKPEFYRIEEEEAIAMSDGNKYSKVKEWKFIQILEAANTFFAEEIMLKKINPETVRETLQNIRNMQDKSKENTMALKGYDPLPIAQEIINIFAKHEIPINFKDIVYKTVDEMLSFQKVESVKISKREE